MLLPCLEHPLSVKYFDTIKFIIETLDSKNQDNTFDKLKKNIITAIDNNQYEEAQHLILNFEYDLDDIKQKSRAKKVLSIGDPDRVNTEASSKYDNKLEMSFTKDTMGSSRSLKMVSPSHLKSASVSTNISSNLSNVIRGDQVGFSRVNSIRIKLPLLRLAVDITMSALEVKKIFINEMTK
jgi:hypothetical protein